MKARLYYTVVELCELFGVSRSTIDRMAKRNELPGRCRFGGQIRYLRAAIDEWVNRGLVPVRIG